MGRWAAPLAILAAGILVISQSIPSRGEVGSTELYGEVPRPVGSLQLEPEHWSSEVVCPLPAAVAAHPFRPRCRRYRVLAQIQRPWIHLRVPAGRRGACVQP